MSRPLVPQIQHALSVSDFSALAALYAADAVLEEVSVLDPPAHPAVAHGRGAIGKRLEQGVERDPVGGWHRTVRSSAVIASVETEEGLAFTELRTYEAGDHVLAVHMAEKRDGLIVRDRMVVAWDAD